MASKNKAVSEQPLVSFILPVYNCEYFLVETLHSILEQTYTNFEVIAINDGSKDDSLKILQKYAVLDKRIRIISRENRGLVATLNEAITEAKGELLARIDGDDLCVPRRLEWQVAAMENNKKAALCYGFFEIFSNDGEFLSKEIRPSHQEDIKRFMYLRNPIAHASVMLRKSLLPEELYNPNVGPTEDYELWSRLAVNNDFVCIPRIIMRYRINRFGIMHTRGHEQYEHMERNIEKYWGYAGPPAVRSIAEIRHNMSRYMHELAPYYLGPAMLEMVLDGESQLGMWAIKKGFRRQGLSIFFNTMFSSRTGFRACRRRLIMIARNILRSKLRLQSS